MAISDNIKKINSKTHIFFFVCFSVSFLICLCFSFYYYSKNNFNPQYEKNSKFILDKNLKERCHKKYMNSYIFNMSIILYLRNLFLISLIFYSINYSLVVNKSDLITTDGKKIMFYDIVRQGLYILVFLTALYYICFDFILPRSEKRINWINDTTYNSIILLDSANKFYFNNNGEEALYYYNEYLNIIENDSKAMERIRMIKNNLRTEEIMNNKNNYLKEITPETTTDYFKLANLYYDKKDYFTAWYYYGYVLKTDTVRKPEAQDKINNIKKILKYENSMKNENEKRSVSELLNYIDEKEREIQNIYLLKLKAKELTENKNYQKAYFVYSDILNINPNLRDVAENQIEVLKELNGISAEISYADKIKIFPGKTNFVFTDGFHTIIQFGRIVKTFDSFYLYDIKIFNFDAEYNLINIIFSPYGKSINADKVAGNKINKIANKITLYSYKNDNRNIEYKPAIINKQTGKTENYSDYFINLPANLEIFYDFSYDYNKTIDFSLMKLFMLKNLSSPDNKKTTIGLNTDFIKTAILDKISLIFLFFSINLIFISLAWRLKSAYIGNIPVLHLILICAIPVFLYFFVMVLKIFVTSFYSILILIGDFNIVLVICFIINILFMILSIIYIASSR